MLVFLYFIIVYIYMMITKYKFIVPDDYVDLLNDLSKIISVLFILNILLYLDNMSENLINLRFIRISILIILAFITYWLIIKKLLVFKGNQDNQ